MKISRLITLLALLSICACGSGEPEDDESVTLLEADVVIRNAKIFTSSAEQSWAEALAISNGQFV